MSIKVCCFGKFTVCSHDHMKKDEKTLNRMNRKIGKLLLSLQVLDKIDLILVVTGNPCSPLLYANELSPFS